MKRIKAFVLMGTRPEVIKMAPLHLALASDSRFESRVLTSGQHTSLLDTALEDFALEANHRLDELTKGASLGHITAHVLEGIESLLEEHDPDVLLVHGDTTTSLAGALAAFYRRVPIGHVEAGLRTHNLNAPFPEEANRQLVARLASWHFSPTQEAVNNLIEEGIDPSRIRITGNTIVDSLRLLEERHFQEHTNRDLESSFSANIPFVLVTLHRRENLEQGMPSILDAVRLFAEAHLDLTVLFPMHPNPAVRTLANKYLAGCNNVKLVEPMGYPNFIAALKSCLFVLTDSGGIQEEAVSLGKIAVVARNASERLDSRAEGSLMLSGTSTESVLRHMNKVLSQTGMRPTSGSLQASIFGDGHASEKIVEILAAELWQS